MTSHIEFSNALRSAGFPLAAGAAVPPPDLLLYFGSALGDDLLCTAVLRELRQRGCRNIWMMTKFPELFTGNLDADVLVNPDEKLTEIVRQFGGRLIVPLYTKPDFINDLGDPIPPAHILAVMCHLAGITGEITLRPYLPLDPSLADYGLFSSRQIAIQTSGAGAAFPMKNKEWLPHRFQEVVDALQSDFTFVQIGTRKDPPLHRVIDLRGKTSLRQAAAVLKNSQLFVGLVGFLMHLARAVDRRAVILYGGRELPCQSGYSCNGNLTHLLPCSPCWRWNRCDYEHACMRDIQSAAVVEAILQQINRKPEPPQDDKCIIEDHIPRGWSLSSSY